MNGDVTLTEAELAVLYDSPATMAEACARIVAARVAAEQERIAQAITDARPGPERDEEPGSWKRGERHGRLRAARIARGVA